MMCPRRHRGFTLIEVIAVLVIVGLLAAAGASLSLAAARAGSRIEDVAGSIEQFDRLARLQAVRSGRAQLVVIEPEHGRITGASAEDTRPWGRPLQLPEAVRITAVRVAGAVVSARGKVSVSVSPNGRTACYALRMSRDGDDRIRWLVFVGMTGRTVEVTNESEVDAILNPHPVPPSGPQRDDPRRGRRGTGNRRLPVDGSVGGERSI